MPDPGSQDQGGDRSRIRRGVLTAFALLIPLAAILVGIVLTNQAPVQPKPVVVLHVVPSRAVVHRAPRATGALVALVVRATTIRTSPAGPRLAPQATTTNFGSPAVLLVRRVRGAWLGVLSPQAGNGKLGWIPASAVTLSRVQWKIEVSLAKRQVTVIDRNRVLKHFTVAIGRPTAPTPTGYFQVTDRLVTHDPAGPYGCCILALSAEAPHAIQGWDGGNRIAIHSTPETSSIGLPVSHGCMRLTLPEGQWLIDHVPLGTPTIIRS